MSTQENKQIVEAIMKELDGRNLDGVTSYYRPDALFYGWGPQALDVNGYRTEIGELLEAFPDSRFTVYDLIAEGEFVVNRHQLRGTHLGSLKGTPASGAQVVVNAIATFRMEAGRVAEVWLNADLLGMLQQIGAIPAGEAA